MNQALQLNSRIKYLYNELEDELDELEDEVNQNSQLSKSITKDAITDSLKTDFS